MRRRLLALIAAVAASGALAAPAFGDTRIIVYPNQNPQSTQQNSNARFQKLSVGDFMRDSVGNTVATAGTFANALIAPGTGLFVTVGPKTAGTNIRVYQLAQNDPNPLPTGGVTPALSADTTVTLISGGTTATSSPLGPLTAPGAGNSVYYLIEAQLAVGVDGNPQTEQFITQNPDGSATQSFSTVNTNRIDQISYQIKAGSAAPAPTQPAVDSGWVAVGYVLVPNGKTQILTSDITLAPSLSGFVQNANVVHVSPSASPSPDSGNAAVTGTSAASQLVSTVSTGTAPLIVSSTTQVANLNAATAGTLSPLPTPSASPPITLTGTWPNQVVACTTCVTSVTTSGSNISSTGGTTPVVSMTASPTFTNATVASNLTLSALASGCLQVNGAGLVSVAACGSGGTVTAVTGSAPIVSSGGSTPAISCTTCVVLNPGSQQTGAINVSLGITSGALTSGRCVQAGTAGLMGNAAGACAVIGTNKTTAVVERFISSTLTVAASVAFPLPSTATGFTVAATSFQCTTPGTSGTNTVQWQYTTTGDPTSASWTSITGATQSWTTAGGTVPSTFTAFSLTGVSATWVRANVTAAGAGPPVNCYLYLHGTQTIQ